VNGPYQPIPGSMKILLLSVLLILVILVPLFGYYETQSGYPGTVNAPLTCASGYINQNTHQCLAPGCTPTIGNNYCGTVADPFEALWTGGYKGIYGRGSPTYVQANPCISNAGCTVAITVLANSLIVLTAFETIGNPTVCGSSPTVSDGDSLTWATIQCTGNPNDSNGIYYTSASTGSNTGSDTITFTDSGAGGGRPIDLIAYDFPSDAGQSVTLATSSYCSLIVCDLGAGQSHLFSYTVSSVTSWSNIVDSIESTNWGAQPVDCVQNNVNSNNSTGTTTDTVDHTIGPNDCYNTSIDSGSQYYFDANLITNGPHTNSIQINDTITNTDPTNTYEMPSDQQILLVGGSSFCPSSYQCGNGDFAYATTDLGAGSYAFALAPNATYPAIVMTSSAVDLSNCASKACAINLDFIGNAVDPDFTAGQEFGWYFSTNGTYPLYQSYDPLTDPSVVAAIVCTIQSTTTLEDCAVWTERQNGVSLYAQAGVTSEDVGSTCATGSTLYLCHQATITNDDGSNFLSLVLNYTGGAGVGTAGQSYACLGKPNTHTGCVVGGGNNVNGGNSIDTTASMTNSTLFPSLNVQNSYYIGFWEQSANSNPMEVLAYTTDAGAPTISYYVPSPATAINTGQQDTGGFFGWLGRTLGGAVNTAVKVVGSAVSTAGSWVQNTALGPIGQVLQGTISWLITQIVSFLNWTGSGFGFPNLGTSLFKLFNSLISIVTATLVNFVSWVVNTGTFILNALTFVIDVFANSIVFGLLAFVAGPALTLLSIILTLVTLFFSFVTPTSYLLLMDWVWGILMVFVIGVSGFLWWIDLNVQIFTFVFRMIWKFVNLIWQGIVIIKSFIPTEGGTPGELKDPTPASGPKGGSGSGGKPEMKEEKPERGEKPSGGRAGLKIPPRGYGQGAKDGDPMSILVMGFMIIVVLYWLSQAAFSPLANVNVVGCIAWSTNCHVQNGVTVGTINTTVFFAYLFNQSHGVSIIFTLFVPLVIVMFAYWFMKNVIGEDKDGRGNDFLNIGGSSTVERTATSRRETMKRYRQRREE
jgi:hypothetical protein